MRVERKEKLEQLVCYRAGNGGFDLEQRRKNEDCLPDSLAFVTGGILENAP